MQNVPGAQGPHGELTELSVTGAQVLAAAVAVMLALSLESLTVATGHGAGNGAGSITTTLSSISAADQSPPDRLKARRDPNRRCHTLLSVRRVRV